MRIVTAHGEYVFSYERDKILEVQGAEGVAIIATNVSDGSRIMVELTMAELASAASRLVDTQKCGVCGADLWTRDDGRWDREVGNICARCFEHSDHPQVVFLRSLSQAVAKIARREDETEEG